MTQEELGRAVQALEAGELVVFPTETLYGIGCDALDGAAVARLCAAKERPQDKGIAVVIGEHAMLSAITEHVDDRARALAERFWPGPLTILFRARPGLPSPLVHDGLIGARVSSDATARGLARALGRPIAAPSANPGGRTPARDVGEARVYFGDRVAVYLDDGDRPPGAASTVVDPGPPLRILRAGAIDESALRRALEPTSTPPREL